MQREGVERILAALLLQGFIEEDFHFTPYAIISYIKMGAKGNHHNGAAATSLISKPKDTMGNSKKRVTTEATLGNNERKKAKKEEPTIIELV